MSKILEWDNLEWNIPGNSRRSASKNPDYEFYHWSKSFDVLDSKAMTSVNWLGTKQEFQVITTMSIPAGEESDAEVTLDFFRIKLENGEVTQLLKALEGYVPVKCAGHDVCIEEFFPATIPFGSTDRFRRHWKCPGCGYRDVHTIDNTVEIYSKLCVVCNTKDERGKVVLPS